MLSKTTKYIIKIQRNYRNNHNIRENKCLSIIDLFNLYPDIMRTCYFKCKKIAKQFPPQKNENKFMYGKLVEMSILNTLEEIGLKCVDLDKNHIIGSEYKNDISLLKIFFSIKAKLNKNGNVILINKKSNNVKHDPTNLNLILCIINTGNIYIFPDNAVHNITNYIKNGSATIEYKSSLFTLIDKKYKKFIYKFPSLTTNQTQFLDKLLPIDLYDIVYTRYIK
jgi:hypothetical protein